MLPITSVVLYKHGVASIERRGAVHDNQSLSLNFKPEEMNDVLKSLTVVDQSGRGQIASISYDNDQPVSVRLENTNLDLSDNLGNLSSFLNQIKGAKITVSDESKEIKVTGSVMGISQTQIDTKERVRQALQLDLLCGDKQIASVILTPETRLQLDDESLQRNLTTHLAILSSGKKQDRKSVTIFAKGEGERPLSVSYTIKAPMWKVSYRIVLNPHKTGATPSPAKKLKTAEETKTAEKEKEKVLIQAWAIVDNISDEKWSDVSLTLMAGQPHSVDCELFTPSYQHGLVAPAPARPMATLSRRNLSNMMPPQQMMNMMPQQQMQQMMPQQQQMQQMQQMQQQPSNFFPSPPSPTTLPSAAKVETEEVGDLFKYELATPVTVNPNQSALVPIAITSSHGSRVAVFQDDKHNNHPNSAVMLVNTTGLTFEKGPVTVLDGSLYVGEAMLETLKPGETRFVEFSTEIAVEVWSTEDKLEQVTSTTIRGGVMTMHQRVIYRKTYKIRSKSSRDIMIYLHHKFRKDCKLLTSETKEQTNPNPINYYIFDVLATASTTTLFKVSEHCTSVNTQRLSSSDSYFDSWFRSNYVDSKTNAVLAAAAQLAGKIRDCERTIKEAEAKLTSISTNQGRLRENLRCLSNSDTEVALRKKYIADMSADEAVLESARKTIVQMNSMKDNLGREREKLFENIELTHTVE